MSGKLEKNTLTKPVPAPGTRLLSNTRLPVNVWPWDSTLVNGDLTLAFPALGPKVKFALV